MGNADPVGRALHSYPADRRLAIATHVIGKHRIVLKLQTRALAEALDLRPSAIDTAVLRIEAPFALRRRGVEGGIVVGDREPQLDRTLLRALLRAHIWVTDLRGGKPLSDVAASTGHAESCIRTRAQLAFLAPSVADSDFEVMMTTRLDGPATRFLPFNKGDGGGKGNPLNPTGHRTAYLWEEVWQRDDLLETLGRYMVATRDAKKQIRGAGQL